MSKKKIDKIKATLVDMREFSHNHDPTCDVCGWGDLECALRAEEAEAENADLKVEVDRLNAVLDEIYEFCYDIRLGHEDVDIEDVLGCYESLKPKPDRVGGEG